MEIKLKGREFYALVSYQEKLPELRITKDNGVIGIDLNGSPLRIAYAEKEKLGGRPRSCQLKLWKFLNILITFRERQLPPST